MNERDICTAHRPSSNQFSREKKGDECRISIIICRPHFSAFIYQEGLHCRISFLRKIQKTGKIFPSVRCEKKEKKTERIRDFLKFEFNRPKIRFNAQNRTMSVIRAQSSLCRSEDSKNRVYRIALREFLYRINSGILAKDLRFFRPVKIIDQCEIYRMFVKSLFGAVYFLHF